MTDRLLARPDRDPLRRPCRSEYWLQMAEKYQDRTSCSPYMCTHHLVDCITDFVGSQLLINDEQLTRSKYFSHQIRISIDHSALHPDHPCIDWRHFLRFFPNVTFPEAGAENVSATLIPLWSCQPNQARNPIWQHLGRWHPTQYYSRHWVSPLATEHSQTPDINKWGRVFNSLPSTPIILIRLHDNCHS